MDKQTVDTYNKMAREYDEETSTFWDRFPSTILDEFVKHLQGTSVLDVGCGPGRDGLLLQDRGLIVEGMDPSKKMVGLCTSRGLPASVGGVLAIPYEDGTYDGVWAYTSLLHVHKSEMPLALQEIRRVLKPNGILGLGMIEGTEETYRESAGVGMPRLFAYYQHDELVSLLEQAGFSAVYSEVFKPGSKRYLNYICTL